MSASIDELQRAMARLCLERAPREDDVALLGDEARIYRSLVRNRLRELLSTALPWTERTIGRRATSALFGAFLAEAPPRSRYFRDVVPDFVAFAEPRIAEPSFPLHARDVLRLEGIRWELAWRHVEPIEVAGEFALEAIPVAHPTLRVLALGSAVHRMDPTSDEMPPRGEFFVCVHRRPDDVVETRTLDATSSALVRGWAEGKVPAIETVRTVLAAEGRAPDAAFVESMSGLLTALLEAGALLGSRAP